MQFPMVQISHLKIYYSRSLLYFFYNKTVQQTNTILPYIYIKMDLPPNKTEYFLKDEIFFHFPF